MVINKTEVYTSIEPLKKGDNSSINILEFIKKLNEKYSIFKNDNLIIDISNNFNIELSEIMLFLPLAKDHKQKGKSFVMVCEGFDIEELMTVPTFKEAEDIIEIEDIERDLGI